jgi:hypothetical protein
LYRAKKRRGTPGHALWCSGITGKNKIISEFLKNEDLDAVETMASRELEESEKMEAAGTYLSEDDLKKKGLSESRVAAVMAWCVKNKKVRQDRYEGHDLFLYVDAESETTTTVDTNKLRSSAYVDSAMPGRSSPEEPLPKRQRGAKPPKQAKQPKSALEVYAAEVKRKAAAAAAVCGTLESVPHARERAPQSHPPKKGRGRDEQRATGREGVGERGERNREKLRNNERNTESNKRKQERQKTRERRQHTKRKKGKEQQETLKRKAETNTVRTQKHISRERHQH